MRPLIAVVLALGFGVYAALAWGTPDFAAPEERASNTPPTAPPLSLSVQASGCATGDVPAPVVSRLCRYAVSLHGEAETLTVDLSPDVAEWIAGKSLDAESALLMWLDYWRIFGEGMRTRVDVNYGRVRIATARVSLWSGPVVEWHR